MSHVASINLNAGTVAVSVQPPVGNLPDERSLSDAQWGISLATGRPYFDPNGATEDELALIALDSNGDAPFMVTAIDPALAPPLFNRVGEPFGVDPEALEQIEAGQRARIEASMHDRFDVDPEAYEKLLENRRAQLEAAKRDRFDVDPTAAETIQAARDAADLKSAQSLVARRERDVARAVKLGRPDLVAESQARLDAARHGLEIIGQRGTR